MNKTGEERKAQCMARVQADEVFINTVNDNNLGEGIGILIGAIKEQKSFKENFDQLLCLCHIFFHYGQRSVQAELKDLMDALTKQEKPDAKVQ